MPILPPVFRWLLALASSLAVVPTPASVSDVKKDEWIVFFPTIAHLTGGGREWIAPVHGWIYEPEAQSVTRNAAIAGFRKTLGLPADQPSTRVFERRARLFLADNERGKRIAIRIGDKTFDLERSFEDGHFFGTLRLDAQTVTRLAVHGRIRYWAITDADDQRRFEGTIHMVRPSGVSVISDIDDTIKVTGVTDRKKLVENTFFLPFRATDGMAELYGRWAGAGAEFHFVSASPWQLYEPLAEFTRGAGFPPATFHLRRIRLKDSSVLSLLADPLAAKLSVIEALMADFPQRQFVLVGDSGERDPEVYGTLAAKHPDQVLRIYIRDVTGDGADSPRYKTAFGQLPRDKWQLFRDPKEIREEERPGVGPAPQSSATKKPQP